MNTIIQRKHWNEVVFSLEVKAPHVAMNAKPGQFVIVIIEEDGERVPLTIAGINPEQETITLVIQAVGYSTKKLAQFNVGDNIPHILGPLGEPAPLEGYKKVLVVGGGVGIAPLYPQAKYLKENGATIYSVLGGRSEEYIIFREAFEEISDEYAYATNDGSLGVEGFVTDVIEKELAKDSSYDLVIAIGPLVMMKAVCEVTRRYNIKTNVSLNPIMVDGTGMCGGCRVTVGDQTRFACVHGPDFDGHLVDFDEAIMRQGIYKKEENHHCRLEGITE
ncbi:sulfide/dihydroorotate dehydrogenase-like FAD/NAD-binding protein [Vallitaleaceae bacterium 9-2]